MKTVGDLIIAIKRFVYNNTNAINPFQGQNSTVDLDTLIDDACLQAVNNARLWAERNGSFSWLDTTVAATFPVGLGVSLDRVVDKYAGQEVGAVATKAGGFLFRFDQNGQLYFAVLADLSEFWSDKQVEDLVAVTVATSIGQNAFGNFAAGKYFPQQTLPETVVNGAVYRVYKIAWRDTSITEPTAWEVGFNTAKPYWGETFKLNAIYSASVVGENGGTTPIDLDTRQAQHIKTTNEINRGFYPGSEGEARIWANSVDPLLKIDGRMLRPNFDYTAPFNVELVGSRWMKEYTSLLDTDPLIQDGFDFMMWQSIVELNYITQVFVARAEGGLSSPEKAAANAWSGLLVNDAFSTTSYFQQK